MHSNAVRNRNITMMLYLENLNCPINKASSAYAIKNDDVTILQHLDKKESNIDCMAVYIAVEHRSKNCMKYMKDNMENKLTTEHYKYVCKQYDKRMKSEEENEEESEEENEEENEEE